MTAEEKAKEIYRNAIKHADTEFICGGGIFYTKEALSKAFNEIYNNAIKDATEAAKTHIVRHKFKDMPTGSQFRTTNVRVPVYEVDKESILSLSVKSAIDKL